MKDIIIMARNSLDMPVHLTLTKVGYKKDDAEILITIGHEGMALKSYYGICIDTDLLPSKEWAKVGALHINDNPEISFSSEE